MIVLRRVSYLRHREAIVDSVDLTIEPGTVTVLLGPPGAGTGTLLRLIGGDLEPTSGTISYDSPAGIARITLDADGVADGSSAAGAPYVVVDDVAQQRREGSLSGSRSDTACRIVQSCARLAGRGAGVIAALREVDLAAAFADRVVLMQRGQVVADGLPEIVLDPNFVRSVFRPCPPRRLTP